MKRYLTIMGNTVKSTFTYRAHVFFQVLASALAILVHFFLWRAVYSSVPGGVEQGVIRGMGFNQTFLYVSLAAAIGVLLRTWIDWEMSWQIRTGDIIMFFFKPIDYMTMMWSSSTGFMIGNLITITVPSFLIVFGVFGARVDVGLNIVFFLCALAGSSLLTFLLDFLVGVTCFWSQSVWGISVAKDMIIVFLSGALMPLTFYPEALLSVIKWLPFPYMYNLPLTILTAKASEPLIWARGLGIQVFWIFAVFLFVKFVFVRAKNKLVVNGG